MKNIQSILAVFIFFSWAAMASASVNCTDPVDTEQGPVTGTETIMKGVCAYRGIPYAAPPVGDLRWKPPLPPPSRDAVLDGSNFGPVCPQPEFMSDGSIENPPPMSEDCLNLNIYRPTSQGAHPVMVFIHGGAFIVGAGSRPIYSGENLSAHGDVVVVTINYRLGPLGFLAHPGLAAEGPYSSSGNYGLLDQIQALIWVRENIASFGGDPDNVTIFGQSAGAYSVYYLMTSPLAQDLFHRAISMSGAPETGLRSDEDYPRGLALAREMGCEGDGAIECMRAKPVEEIMDANKKAVNLGSVVAGGPEFKWWPRIDGWSITEPPLDSLRSGNYNRVPFMLGTTRDEIKFFLLAMPKWVARAPKFMVGWFVKKVYGPGGKEAMTKYYPFADYPKPLYAAMDFMDDSIFTCPNIQAAEAVSRYQPTYMYRFDYDDHSEPVRFGAAHSFDLPFIFNTFAAAFAQIYTPEQVERAQPLVKNMMSYWTNFARNGDPNGDNLEEWPAFHKDAEKRMILDIPRKVTGLDFSERCEYHDKNQAPFWKPGEK